MSVWIDWVPANSSSFAQRYRRNPVIRYKNEYEVGGGGTPYSGMLRGITEMVFSKGQRFEIEDILDKADGMTARALVRTYYPHPKQETVLAEHTFRSYLEAETYVVENCED